MTAKPLPSTAAVTGLKETLDFFNDPSFAQRRFDAYGDVFATKLLAQRIVFIRGERAITELLNQGDSLEGWWPESVKQLLGSRSLANRSGPGHKARRRVVGQLFSSAALVRYTPSITGLIDELANDVGGECDSTVFPRCGKRLHLLDSWQLNRQFRRQLQHLNGLFRTDIDQHQAVGVARSLRRCFVRGGVNRVCIEADDQHHYGFFW